MNSLRFTFLQYLLPLLFMLSVSLQTTAETYPAYCRVNTTLNVRRGPSTRYSRIGRLYRNDNIIVNSITQNGSRQWGAIDYGGQTGYVALQYVSYQEPVEQEVQEYQPANSYETTGSWHSVEKLLAGAWQTIKWCLIIFCILIILAFKEEIFRALFFIGMFMGGGGLLFWILFDNWSLGVTIGFILGVFIGMRLFLQSIGTNWGYLFVLLYYLVSIPSWICNRLQFILINPWKYIFKYISVGDTTRSVLRPLLNFIQILLYIAATPLRLLNAIYYNIFVYGITEIYDLTCEVFIPTNYNEGKDDFWEWILWFPIRLAKYPIYHGTLVLIEGMIWTVIDIFIPTVTMYHGTNLEAANIILGCSNRNSNLWRNWLAGTFKASTSDNGWGGLGVYFAPSRRVASSYSGRANGVVFIACRVSLGKIINYALAPQYVEFNTGRYGRHSVLNNYANDNGYDTAEWWNGAYWEYCMYDWKNKYNYPWRIRPIYVFNIETGFAQHIDGGFRHWLFSEMVINDILQSPRFIFLLILAVLIVILLLYYGCDYLYARYLWYYFL
ncbi:MAG: SH3 domain-containing protein [Bacteroidaceae bacterium]|nr:SH3 domain-containing protein [Bacteroidaceae bacterium]